MSLWWYDCRASGGFNLLRFFFILLLLLLFFRLAKDLILEGTLSPLHQYSMPLNCFLTRSLAAIHTHTHSLSLSRQFYFLTRFRNRHSVKRWLCFWLAGRRLGVWFSPIVRKLSCLCLPDSNVYIYICTYSRHNTLVITWNICINWKKRIARQIVHTII